MVKEISKEGWNKKYNIFRILLEILYVFQKQDDSKNHFPGNEINEGALRMYKQEHGKFVIKAKTKRHIIA